MSSPSASGSISRLYVDLLHIAAGVTNQWDQFLIHAIGQDLIAPAWLRYRVQGTPDLQTYLEAGRLSRQSIGMALSTMSKQLGQFRFRVFRKDECLAAAALCGR